MYKCTYECIHTCSTMYVLSTHIWTVLMVICITHTDAHTQACLPWYTIVMCNLSVRILAVGTIADANRCDKKRVGVCEVIR